MYCICCNRVFILFFCSCSYYDRIAHTFSPDIKVQIRVGITCVLLAGKSIIRISPLGKYEECEMLTPSFSYFCDNESSLFTSVEEMGSYERVVLER